jgi:hypothetical protein
METVSPSRLRSRGHARPRRVRARAHFRHHSWRSQARRAVLRRRCRDRQGRLLRNEQWASSAHNGDHIYVFSPACVVQLGAPVEIGTNLVNFRSNGVIDATASLTAKTVPIPLPGGGRPGFGLALSSAFVWDLTSNTLNGLILNVPLSYDFSKALRLNMNVGMQYLTDPSVLLATAGVGVSWNFVDQWSIISEVFALMGPVRRTHASKPGCATTQSKRWIAISSTDATSLARARTGSPWH